MLAAPLLFHTRLNCRYRRVRDHALTLDRIRIYKYLVDSNSDSQKEEAFC